MTTVMMKKFEGNRLQPLSMIQDLDLATRNLRALYHKTKTYPILQFNFNIPKPTATLNHIEVP